ncbi:MAG: hypothetical protein KA146_06975 [Leptospiraceae bacterium]|nr:hypothetical protein [Leptospiraceae bacterium]
MPSYTEPMIIEKLEEAMKRPETLYQEDFINYRGRTKDSQKRYSEIIAEKLLKELEIFKEIKSITRETSYKTKSHDGQTLNPDSNRKEERIALSMHNNDYAHTGRILDYQIPLKNKQTDEVGKIDLLSVNAEKELILLELKGIENKETLLRCVLEVNTYWHLLNRSKLRKDFNFPENTTLKKAVLVNINGAQHEEYKNNPNIRNLMEKLDVQIFLYEIMDGTIENISAATDDNLPTIEILRDEFYTEKSGFKERRIKHLNEYKTKNLELANLPKGKFTFRKKLYEYNHILPKNERAKNFIEYYRNNFIDSHFYNENMMHLFSHHLNSSQAMCINFFFPLVHEKKLEYVLEFLKSSSFPTTIGEDEKIRYDKVEFEKKSEDETSFDFYFETVSGKKFYFEIKYTEGEFGKAKADDSHKEKFDRVYKKNLERLTEKYKDKLEFLNNYQILRNLIHIDKNSYVVFVYPEGNKKIKEQAEEAKDKMLIKDWEKHFFPTTWEDLFEEVTKKPMNEKLKNQYNEFDKKYFLK